MTHLRCRRRGNASIEFALIAPVLLLLLGGVVEWSQFTTQELDMLHAVREGARLGASEGALYIEEGELAELSNLVEGRVQSVLDEMGHDGSTAAVLVETDAFEGNDLVRVSCELPYKPLIRLIPTPDRLSAELTMLVEQ